MSNLDRLFKSIEAANDKTKLETGKIADEIQRLLNVQYSDWTDFQKALSQLENHENVEYCTDECGDATAYIRFCELANVPEQEREFFEVYLSENHFAYVDWDCETLTSFLGSDEIFIVDDGRTHDCGVYQNGKQIIAESEYTDEENDVNETKRNELIEAHMERTGCFPRVYETNNRDNTLYPVSTIPNTKGV